MVGYGDTEKLDRFNQRALLHGIFEVLRPRCFIAELAEKRLAIPAAILQVIIAKVRENSTKLCI